MNWVQSISEREQWTLKNIELKKSMVHVLRTEGKLLWVNTVRGQRHEMRKKILGIFCLQMETSEYLPYYISFVTWEVMGLEN